MVSICLLQVLKDEQKREISEILSKVARTDLKRKLHFLLFPREAFFPCLKRSLAIFSAIPLVSQPASPPSIPDFLLGRT